MALSQEEFDSVMGTKSAPVDFQTRLRESIGRSSSVDSGAVATDNQPEAVDAVAAEPKPGTNIDRESSLSSNLSAKGIPQGYITSGLDSINSGEAKSPGILDRIGSALPITKPLIAAQRAGVDIIKGAAEGFVEGSEKGADVRGEIADTENMGSKGLRLIESGVHPWLGAIDGAIGEAFSQVNEQVLGGRGDEAFSAGFNFLAETESGKESAQLAKDLSGEWSKFKQSNPELARDLQSAGVLVSLVSEFYGGRAVKNTGKEATKGFAEYAAKNGEKILDSAARTAREAVFDVGEEIVESSTKQALKNKLDDARGLIQEKRTSKVSEAQIKRGLQEEGIIFEKDAKLSDFEEQIAVDVAELADVAKSKSKRQNVVEMNKAAVTEAEKLKAALDSQNAIFTKKEFNSKFNKAVEELKASPTLVGSAEKSAKKVIKGFEGIMEGRKNKLSELLDARKDFDKWLEKNGVSLDKLSETGKANSLAVKKIRNTINDFIDAKATGAGVKESLRKQRSLYIARDRLASRAVGEAPTKLGRVVQSIGKLTGLKGKLGQAAGAVIATGGATAVAGAAAALPFLAPLAAAGAITYKGGKLITSPKTKKAIGESLKFLGKQKKTKEIDNIIEEINEIKNDIL